MSILVVANQKTIKMLPIVWVNLFNQNEWSSKVLREDRIKGTMTFLVSVGGGKNPPRTKNQGCQNGCDVAILCPMSHWCLFGLM
jgi:hypothetical protein